MKYIRLTNSDIVVTIDDEDYERVVRFKWSANMKEDKLIAIQSSNGSLARIILRYFGPLDIDHKDRNPANNQKFNLRIATRSDNNINKSKQTGNYSSKYKCVCFDISKGQFRVSISRRGVRYSGGLFDSEIDAAIKANELMIKYHGKFARLNNV